MPLTDTSTIILVVALVVVAALLVWLSLSMAAAESAVGRVTRAGLNNKILEVQTDTETSQFIRMKKIGKIHTVQRLIANRYATSGSCAFFRITCNVFDGVLVACVASLLDAPIWLQLLCGFLFALIVGIVSVLVRPRSAGASKPIDIMLNLAGLVRFATAITPFAKAGEQKGQKRRSKESDLSDDEELEKIQLEQGRATIDRLVEANDFDPEVSEMLRNVLTLSETLTREIMVPRTDMICMDRTATLADMLRLCSRSGFSRVPVIGDDVDDLIGVAYLKDAVRATAFNPAASQRYVPPSSGSRCWFPSRSRWMTCSTPCSRPGSMWRSSSTNTAASPDWSPSRTPSSRSSANLRTSTTARSIPSPRRSANASGRCRRGLPSPPLRRCSRSTSTRTTSTPYMACSPSCWAASRSSAPAR